MSGISITKATYGSGSASVDVTSTVASKVKDGVLSFTVSPTALNVDDPAPGQIKQLDITYTVNGGSSNTESAKDNDPVWIDAPPAREASGLQIVKAEYGYTGNFTDVTDAVQSMVKDGHIDMTVGYKEVGIPDPNPNKQKELAVSYTVNGAPSTQTIKDGKRFKLSAPPVEGSDRRSASEHAGGIIKSFFKNAYYFVGVFLHILGIYTAYYLGKQIVGQVILACIAFIIPGFTYFILPFFIFFIRLFRSSDIVTLEAYQAAVSGY